MVSLVTLAQTGMLVTLVTEVLVVQPEPQVILDSRDIQVQLALLV
jgi:hypothetical protein